jgi:hypothetical protein
MNRRRFLKYAGVGVVAGTAAVGGLAHYLGEKTNPPEGVITAATSTWASTSTSESTVPYYPPKIVDLSYMPTRVVNDKVYDIRITLSLNNPSKNLTDLEVRLVPTEYPHLSREAFPEEETRIIHPSFGF